MHYSLVGTKNPCVEHSGAEVTEFLTSSSLRFSERCNGHAWLGRLVTIQACEACEAFEAHRLKHIFTQAVGS